MFGNGRFTSLLGERRMRATIIGATIGCVVIAASAGYTVQNGDTLGEIARKHGTTISALSNANGISNPNRIRAGQVLTIPGAGAGGESVRHKVKRGESLSEIAARYRVSVSALAGANDISNPNVIRIGQTLTVPGGGTGSGATTTHVVRAGETLGTIAARYGTTAAKLAELNGIRNPSLIIAGATLTVTGSSGGSTSTATEQTHTVKSGETLSEIAARYGTTTSAIVRLNGLRSADSIRVGQTLRIPAGGGTQGGGGSTTAMTCPVPGSTFVNDYGYIKPDGRFHQGIDLFAAKGTNVYAPVAGTVEAVNGTIGGLQFWLEGDDGRLYIGTHLNGFGQVGRVPAGAVIGTVGDTGNAIGAPPHLHFEILENGKTVNPYQRLVAACR
jgi:LysM repeat protein